MKNITDKQISLRSASASGRVYCRTETIALIKAGKIEKGNLFEFARAAAFLGAKQTQHLLPHCHPVGIDAMEVAFTFLEDSIHDPLFEGQPNRPAGIFIQAQASSIGRTGIEMEVLTAISIAALELYDFLKPHDKDLEISSIRLEAKTGGKSDPRNQPESVGGFAVLVCSDRLGRSAKNPASRDADLPADRSGVLIQEILQAKGATALDYAIVEDEPDQIKAQILDWVKAGIPFIFTTGGTGIGHRDQTVEAIRDIMHKEVPGLAEAMRASGKIHSPRAVLGRSIAVTIENTLVVALPGSPAGVQESLDAILPAIFHARDVLEGKSH